MKQHTLTLNDATAGTLATEVTRITDDPTKLFVQAIQITPFITPHSKSYRAKPIPEASWLIVYNQYITVKKQGGYTNG